MIFPEKTCLVPSLFESLAKIIFVPQIRDRNDIVFDGGIVDASIRKKNTQHGFFN